MPSLLFFYLRQKRRYMRLAAMFVRLSFSKIIQKRVHLFGLNFVCRQASGHGRTDHLLSQIRIIVRIPEPENMKDEDLSKSVKEAPHSEQATSHGMHCREILFTPRCSPRVTEFRGSVDFSVGRTFAELPGVKLAQFSDFGLYRRYVHSTSSFVVFLVIDSIAL